MINYLDQETSFQALVDATSSITGFTNDEVIKDYYMTRVLRNVVKDEPGIVLKGGTSLSKAYNITHRFSEDLDLAITLDIKNSMTRNGGAKFLYNRVIEGITNAGFDYAPYNEENGISERRAMNQVDVVLPRKISQDSLRKNGLLEAEVFSPAFPTEIRDYQSYIGRFIEKNIKNSDDAIARFPELSRFSITVQKPERTMIDKVFALADGPYMSREDNSNIRSRDLYDILKINDYLKSSNYDFTNFPNLISKVRLARYETQKTAFTAQPGIIVYDSLEKALSGQNLADLREDYIRNTKELISSDNDDKSFDQLIKEFQKMINGNNWETLRVANRNEKKRIIIPKNLGIENREQNR